MGDDFLALHHHVDEVVSHVEDSVRAIQQDILVVIEALKVVEGKLLDLLEHRYVQRVLFGVLIVGQECSTNSIVFIDRPLLNDHVFLTSNFVDN